MIETVDRRILGAFRCVDAIAQTTVLVPLELTAPGLTLRGNRSGTYAVLDAPGLSDLTSQFLAGAWPAAAPFEVTIVDPSNHYLPRRANLQLPQSSTGLVPPAVPQPQDVLLYPSAAAGVGPNWAVVRASVVSAASPGAGLGWAYVRIVRTSDAKTIATGLADARGEALLAVCGLSRQVGASASGPVSTATTPVTIQAFYDPSTSAHGARWLPNPDDLIGAIGTPSSLKTGSVATSLSPGQTFITPLPVSVS